MADRCDELMVRISNFVRAECDMVRAELTGDGRIGSELSIIQETRSALEVALRAVLDKLP